MYLSGKSFSTHHFLIWNKIKSTDSGRLKTAERSLILLSSRGKIYVASTWIWGVPVIALYNTMWQKWCCTSFWKQSVRSWQHLPPAPWCPSTRLKALSCHIQSLIILTMPCWRAVHTQMLQSTVSAESSLPATPPRHQTSKRSVLHSPDQPICQVNTTEGHPLRQKRSAMEPILISSPTKSWDVIKWLKLKNNKPSTFGYFVM